MTHSNWELVPSDHLWLWYILFRHKKLQLTIRRIHEKTNQNDHAG